MELGGNRLVKYRLTHQPLVVTISAVTDAKDALSIAVAQLGGEERSWVVRVVMMTWYWLLLSLESTFSRLIPCTGHVISDWRRGVSTHCCMESIAVTIKTISALVTLKPVVTPAFFQTYLSNALKVKRFSLV